MDQETNTFELRDTNNELLAEVIAYKSQHAVSVRTVVRPLTQDQLVELKALAEVASAWANS
jgi:hypothetical protein